ncbi:MAG: hypothetical protein A2017_01595 [Lentisphaerae bacterium GWF2_44_16]|nr:MAG: hypothetical protein A2017_01595 [Lentisphaerae bacterium GWF2_44_16]
MTSREIVKRTILFQNPERLARSFPEKYGNDFDGIGMSPSPDYRPSGTNAASTDEWGAVWENIGISKLGEVKEFPLPSWDDWGKLKIPDVNEERRWAHLKNGFKNPDEKFIMAQGLSLYERVHFIRGLENTWLDIYENPEKLENLIELLAEMNVQAIEKYKQYKPDGYMFCDDWGLQNKLMISPEKWRELWKPRYAKVYKAAHEAGMLTFLHSCGYITDILDDLIEAGLDVIQMDQQENMGLEELGKRFKGRITFWCPVDIQNTMCRGPISDIKHYCRKLIENLADENGGFIPKWYGDPVGAGHSQEAIDAMCSEFIRLSREIYGN